MKTIRQRIGNNLKAVSIKKNKVKPVNEIGMMPFLNDTVIPGLSGETFQMVFNSDAFDNKNNPLFMDEEQLEAHFEKVRQMQSRNTIYIKGKWL